MRMDAGRDESAAHLVNTLAQDELVSILRTYGEEKRAQTVARAIIAARPIARTGELAAIIERTARARRPADPSATRTFQALRIAVNDELGELERGLDVAECVLNAKGRLAVVAFHSLEDRIVKRFLTERSGRASRGSRHAPAQESSREPTFHVSGKAAPHARTE